MRALRDCPILGSNGHNHLVVLHRYVNHHVNRYLNGCMEGNWQSSVFSPNTAEFELCQHHRDDAFLCRSLWTLCMGNCPKRGDFLAVRPTAVYLTWHGGTNSPTGIAVCKTQAKLKDIPLTFSLYHGYLDVEPLIACAREDGPLFLSERFFYAAKSCFKIFHLTPNPRLFRLVQANTHLLETLSCSFWTPKK